MRGYFGIGVENVKTTANVGGLWRSAHAFGAAFIFTLGHRYYRQPTDTTKTWKSIPLFQLDDFDAFMNWRPQDCILVGVETSERSIIKFHHPERAIYLLGAEDHGLTLKARSRCSYIVTIPTQYCLNVATAGSIVMFDRIAKSEATNSQAQIEN